MRHHIGSFEKKRPAGLFLARINPNTPIHHPPHPDPGTESIILAAKAHREYYREVKGVAEGEIVACVSAHAAIQKAADLMGLRLVLVPMDPKTFKADVAAMCVRAVQCSAVQCTYFCVGD